MLSFHRGNLLESGAQALVNTVNTVGVMGKGIALMFKEAFPDNYRRYAVACKRGEVRVGTIFVTEGPGLTGPRWIVNFPTKQHWRNPTRLEWVQAGLADLRRFISEQGVTSVAVPPLGCGNGGLDWKTVKPLIEVALGDLDGVEVLIYEPTSRYQNVAKQSGVETLTPARAMVAEMVRRYWILGIECSLLEVQKLAWFLERAVVEHGLDNVLDLRFSANRYGPYSDRLRHLLDGLDGSYLRSERRLADAGPSDVIAFDDSKRKQVDAYLRSEAAAYTPALEAAAEIVDGFESPLGMELLATVDWLLIRGGCRPRVDDLQAGLAAWHGGNGAGERKLRLFDERLLGLALDRLVPAPSRPPRADGP